METVRCMTCDRVLGIWNYLQHKVGSMGSIPLLYTFYTPSIPLLYLFYTPSVPLLYLFYTSSVPLHYPFYTSSIPLVSIINYISLFQWSYPLMIQSWYFNPSIKPLEIVYFIYLLVFFSIKKRNIHFFINKRNIPFLLRKGSI